MSKNDIADEILAAAPAPLEPHHWTRKRVMELYAERGRKITYDIAGRIIDGMVDKGRLREVGMRKSGRRNYRCWEEVK